MGLNDYVARDFLGFQPKTTPWVWDEVPYWCTRQVDSFLLEGAKYGVMEVVLVEMYSPLSGMRYEVKFASWLGPLASGKTLGELCVRLNGEPTAWKQKYRYDEIINWLRSVWHS